MSLTEVASIEWTNKYNNHKAEKSKMMNHIDEYRFADDSVSYIDGENWLMTPTPQAIGTEKASIH